VGHDLQPVLIAKQRAAGRNDPTHLWHQVDDFRKSKGHSLERGLTEIERSRVERQPRHRALRVLMPPDASLTAQQREECQAVRIRVAVRERPIDVPQRLAQPADEISAVGERTTLDDAAVVNSVEEESGPRTWNLGF